MSVLTRQHSSQGGTENQVGTVTQFTLPAFLISLLRSSIMNLWVECPWWQRWRLRVGPTAWTNTNPPVAISECPDCQHPGPVLTPWYHTIPRGDQLATWQPGDYTGLSLLEGQHFIFTGIDTYPGMNLFFLHVGPSPVTLFVDSESSRFVGHMTQHLTRVATSQKSRCSSGAPLAMSHTILCTNSRPQRTLELYSKDATEVPD